MGGPAAPRVRVGTLVEAQAVSASSRLDERTVRQRAVSMRACSHTPENDARASGQVARPVDVARSAANRRFLEGADKVDAIVAGARSRFVPIVMTSLATVIGLIPTAMALEHGSEANQPLALAVVGGLTSSTILSLFLCPVMFLFFAKKTTPAVEPHRGT